MMTVKEALHAAAQHHQAGRFREAEHIYRQILQVAPTHKETWHRLGILTYQTGRLEEAATILEKTAHLAGNHFMVLNDWGAVLRALRRHNDAIACYNRAIQSNPSYPVAHYNLGNVLSQQGRAEEAIGCYRRALALKPDYFEAHYNLGNTLAGQYKSEEAARCYRRVLELKPDHVDALLNLGNTFKDRGLLHDALGYYRRAVELNPDHSASQSNLLYALWFTPGMDISKIAEEHRRWEQTRARSLYPTSAAYPNNPDPIRRLRVGYVCPDFRDHVVGRNILPLLREHDRQQVEVFCYASVTVPDDFTQRFRELVDSYRDVLHLSDDQLAELVREDNIDILVDLSLHMAGNRILAFARKPAPVQATFAGYPGTTGLSVIDYRLTDPYLDPLGLDKDHYSETSIRLPNTFWCYELQGDEPDVGPLPAAEGEVTFGCLNHPCKVNDDIVLQWTQVLRELPGSQLLLLCPDDSHRCRVTEILECQGISRDRVRMTGILPRRDYLALYNKIDIALDTLPYNGHTTSLDALWMGVPVVTQRGSTLVGRAGVSQLINLGLGELVANSTDEYVAIATGLANDLGKLIDFRANLRQRMRNSPLTDAPHFARVAEDAFRQMWYQWCKSLRSD